MAVVAKADHSLRVVEITFRKPKKSDGQASRAEDAQPNLKWVVEWLVNLGVNRKTVALALRRERLTGRMTHAVQRLMANLDEPGWERTTPLDQLEARIKLVIETVDDLARLVDHLTRRVEALEEGRGESGNDAVGNGQQTLATESDNAADFEPEAEPQPQKERGVRRFGWRLRR